MDSHLRESAREPPRLCERTRRTPLRLHWLRCQVLDGVAGPAHQKGLFVAAKGMYILPLGGGSTPQKELFVAADGMYLSLPGGGLLLGDCRPPSRTAPRLAMSSSGFSEARCRRLRLGSLGAGEGSQGTEGALRVVVLGLLGGLR